MRQTQGGEQVVVSVAGIPVVSAEDGGVELLMGQVKPGGMLWL